MPRSLDWKSILPKPTPAVPRPAVKGGDAVDLLAAIWPEPNSGVCHTAGLALGGILGSSGWSETEAMAFADEVFAAAGIEGANLPDAAHASFTARRAGGKAYGRPKLRECLAGTEAQADAVFLALDTLMRSTNLKRGDDTEIANCILGQQLKGAVSDEGAIWLQNESGVWEEVPSTRIDVWVMEFSGMEYVGEEPNAKKTLAVGAPRCKSVRFLIESKLADQTGPGFFSQRTPGVAFQNGLLRLDGRGLAPLATARVRRTLPMAYPPVGPSTEWDAFMASVWGADREAIECLEEVMGYLLSGRTDLQKAFVFVGARRAGKSLILRLLERLLGDAVCAVSVHELGERFGLENLLGKSIATHDDFRKSGFQNAGASTQKFLSITGEGMQTVQRKGTTNVNCRLPCRFVLSTNVSFGMADLGGAVSSRLVLLYFAQGHLGKEDLGLENRLRGQLPGFVRRALEGLDRLRARGHFHEPASSAEERAASEEIENPMVGIQGDVLDLVPDSEESCTVVHHTMRDWREENGLKKMSTASFKSILKSWGVHQKQVGARNYRRKVYRGVQLTKSTVHPVGAPGAPAVHPTLKN